MDKLAGLDREIFTEWGRKLKEAREIRRRAQRQAWEDARASPGKDNRGWLGRRIGLCWGSTPSTAPAAKTGAGGTTSVRSCALRRSGKLRDRHECDKPSRPDAAKSRQDVPAPHLRPAGENSSSRRSSTTPGGQPLELLWEKEALMIPGDGLRHRRYRQGATQLLNPSTRLDIQCPPGNPWSTDDTPRLISTQPLRDPGAAEPYAAGVSEDNLSRIP